MLYISKITYLFSFIVLLKKKIIYNFYFQYYKQNLYNYMTYLKKNFSDKS